MIDSFAIFSTTAAAIVIEAAPFLLLGSLVGAIVELFVSDEALLKILPRKAVGQVAAGMFAGMLLPACECGIVPIARRLLVKGVPPRVVFPYMMAAPVVNPIVIGSTLFAFQGDAHAAILRVLVTLLPAAAFGLALGNTEAAAVLRNGTNGGTPPHSGCAHSHTPAHAHTHECGCCPEIGTENRFKALLLHTAAEFVSMSRFLVLGAVAAAGFKTFLPPGVLGYFTDNIFLAVGGLMLLAVLLSVCSEADAFVAASFSSFPLASKVAFMALGPMLDLKLAPLFFAVFHRRIAVALIVVPVVTIYVTSVILGLGGL